jgi:hypothetical protein
MPTPMFFPPHPEITNPLGRKALIAILQSVEYYSELINIIAMTWLKEVNHL